MRFLTAKRVGGLQSFGECVLTTAKRVQGLLRFEVRFDYRKAGKRLAEVQSVRFDHSKACRMIADVWRVRFYHRKACKRLSSALESVF